MRCMFCDKPVHGRECMPLPNEGVAQQKCFQANEVMKRTFQHLDISALNDQELVDLKDLVLAEENSRNAPNEDGDIELF